MKPVVSCRDLSSRLGVPTARLRAIAENVHAHYKAFPLVDKKKQKVRMLQVPDGELKGLQARIKSNILDRLGFEDAAHGGICGRSPRTNASQHLGQRCVINLDVKNFFPNVRHYVVYRMFRQDFGFGRDVARLLTRLTTLRGYLPQGTPTSTAIANVLLALPVDRPLAMEASRQDARYTRFVDDITLSGNNPRSLINLAGRMLSQRRLPLYRRRAHWPGKPKLTICSRGAPQEVTGLIVNSPRGPSVSKRRRDSVRAAIHALRGLTGEDLATALRSVRGRISYVRQFNPRSAVRLEKYLAGIALD